MPFYKVWKAEGGPEDPGAWTAAITHCSRCLAMSGPWVSINPLTDRIEFPIQ